MNAERGKVLLVIPCFRESGRVGPLLRSLREQLDATVRVLLVDDGSGPEEVEQLREAMHGSGLEAELHVLPVNQGKGGAVYAGWSQHRNESWLAFVDADGSCPAYEVKRLIDARDDGAIFASRIMMLGRSIQRHWRRHLIGRVFATLVGTLLKVPVYDSQCGLKLVPFGSWDAIRASLSLKGFAFDVELLCALLDSGCSVREEPIDWHEVPGGKVHLLRDSWRMFRDVMAIRARRS